MSYHKSFYPQSIGKEILPHLKVYIAVVEMIIAIFSASLNCFTVFEMESLSHCILWRLRSMWFKNLKCTRTDCLIQEETKGPI